MTAIQITQHNPLFIPSEYYFEERLQMSLPQLEKSVNSIQSFFCKLGYELNEVMVRGICEIAYNILPLRKVATTIASNQIKALNHPTSTVIKLDNLCVSFFASRHPEEKSVHVYLQLPEPITEKVFKAVRITFHEIYTNTSVITITLIAQLDSSYNTEDERKSSNNRIKTMKKLSKCEQTTRLYGAIHAIQNKMTIYMEHMQCDLHDFWEKIANHKNFPQEILREYCIKIGLELSRAISFMHEQGLIHKDIKLENILCNWHFQENKAVLDDVKLGDFEMTAHLDDKEMLYTPSGSFNYLSPERLMVIFSDLGISLVEILQIARSDNPLDIWATIGKPLDLWAIGCVLFLFKNGNFPPIWLALAELDKCDLALAIAETSHGRNSTVYQILLTKARNADQGVLKAIETQHGKLPAKTDELDSIIDNLLKPNPRLRLTTEAFNSRVEELAKKEGYDKRGHKPNNSGGK